MAASTASPRLDRLRAQIEDRRDLARAPPLANETEHLQLAVAERRERRFGFSVAADETRRQLHPERFAHIDPAATRARHRSLSRAPASPCATSASKGQKRSEAAVCSHARSRSLDLGELFGGQGRAKAGVLAAQKPFDPVTDARPEPPQRNPPTLLGDKPGVALPPIGANQPFHLPNANPQPLARRALAESLCNHKPNNMRALTFSAAHPQNLVPQTSPLPESAEKGTFSRCTKGTIPCCGNTRRQGLAGDRNECYVHVMFYTFASSR